MRTLWMLVGGLALATVGYVVGSQIGRTAPASGHGRITSGPERLRAGYVEIPVADASCADPSKQSGFIVIRLSNLLDTLKAGKTIKRDIGYFPDNDLKPQPQLPPDPNAVVNLKDTERQGFFATQLDFSTRLRTAQFDPKLVRQGKFVMVRVVLDAATNPDVEFLRPDQPGLAMDSAFAVMAAADTGPRKMLFCRKPIMRENGPGGSQYVDFGIKSTGQPETGSFGIGLLVREPGVSYVTPIILDPAVRNEG